MTKPKLTPQQQLRKELDKQAQEVCDVAQHMIDDGVPVVLAFKLAFTWELEIQYYRMLNGTKTLN